MIHTIKFDHTTAYDDLQGWESKFPGNQTFGQGGYSLGTMFHDIFEHGFENCEIFETDQLSIEGECFAMGIREYIKNQYNLAEVEKHLYYNKAQGYVWNSIAVIEGLISDYECGEYEYPIAGSFSAKYHTGYYDSDFIGYFPRIDAEKYPTIHKSFSAGYETAEKIYQDADLLNYFAQWLDQVFKELHDIGERNPYEAKEGYAGASIEILFDIDEKMGLTEITFKGYNFPCEVSDSWKDFIREFTNKEPEFLGETLSECTYGKIEVENLNSYEIESIFYSDTLIDQLSESDRILFELKAIEEEIADKYNFSDQYDFEDLEDRERNYLLSDMSHLVDEIYPDLELETV